jgi:zinc transport system ATP-binding protein
MSVASYALEVSHLRIAFGRVPVLDDLSFQVTRGSAVTIIGPNGSGKTVLFKALIGAIRGQGMIRWAPDTRIGYVPEARHRTGSPAHRP